MPEMKNTPIRKHPVHELEMFKTSIFVTDTPMQLTLCFPVVASNGLVPSMETSARKPFLLPYQQEENKWTIPPIHLGDLPSVGLAINKSCQRNLFVVFDTMLFLAGGTWRRPGTWLSHKFNILSFIKTVKLFIPRSYRVYVSFYTCIWIQRPFPRTT